MKILAIDDEPCILEILSLTLSTMCACTVETALSGPQALKMIKEARTPYDCFLVDIQMPVMNGVVLCNEIRRLSTYSRTPILMLTAMSQVKYVDQAFSAGATDYVTKPFDFRELRQRIAQARKLASRNAWIAETAMERAMAANGSGDDVDQISSLSEEMDGARAVIGRGELENYIAQISRSSTHGSCVFGAKLKHADRLFETLPLTEFKAQLSNILEQMLSGLDSASTMVSYLGGGVFVCVSHDCMITPEREYEQRVNDALSGEGGNDVSSPLAFGQRLRLDAGGLSGNMEILARAVNGV